MQEKQKKWILRIALYLIGIMVLALGITLNTKTKHGVLGQRYPFHGR